MPLTLVLCKPCCEQRPTIWRPVYTRLSQLTPLLFLFNLTLTWMFVVFLAFLARKNIMKVVLCIEHTYDDKVLAGAIHTIRFAMPHLNLFNYVGFDVSMNDKIEDIAKMYERLGVHRNRWQGDGISNCLFVWSYKRLMQAISYRDSNKYIDKVYYWTIDKKRTIRKVIRKGVDAIITNYPNSVREVLEEREFKKTVRLATYLDNPWRRFQTKRTKHRQSKLDSDMDEMVDEASEFDFEPFPLPVSPRKPRPSRIRAIRHSYNEWPQYSPLRPFY